MNRRRAVSWVLGLGFLAAVAGVSPRSDAVFLAQGGIPAVGKPAPDFTLKDLDGRTHRLSDHRGQVVFINFWATWCPPCRSEMPSMEALYQIYRDKGLVMLAVNYKESPQRVREFMQDFGLSFPALLDRDGKVTRSYGIRGIPATFIVDTQGIVRHVHLGEADWTEPKAKKLVEELLREISPSAASPPPGT